MTSYLRDLQETTGHDLAVIEKTASDRNYIIVDDDVALEVEYRNCNDIAP
jgi:hypothetical protein